MNILILGKSLHFLSVIKNRFPRENIVVVNWREIVNSEPLKIQFDLVFICGYDYSSYLTTYHEYFLVNIKRPYYYIAKNINKNTKVVYICTRIEDVQRTFSRYYYAKISLVNLLKKKFLNLYIIEIDTLVDKNKLLVRSDMFTKLIMHILINLKIAKTTHYEDVDKLIFESTSNSFFSSKIRGQFLLYKRTGFIDKLLRLFLG
ncbi:hypothetical protein [Polynucleobacter sp. Nonnen-W13]|uniref:hypothetical protein n=1 Tax=Polynucleobacter sp. Nonnen-W13 TaxID=1855625 RepID=UPI001C0CAD51|nr:hypothetical protein [Polynucleobacter sp. Nonnen-W13]MBU3558368.1 hypothetical protein [Polynucleobacter sp. Nonnen-W13]